MPSVLQDWVHELPFMQQTTLLTAVRGPDGQAKYDPPKMLLRWYRRCILISALDGEVLTHPYDKRGGSFTGPSVEHIKITYPLSYDMLDNNKWHHQMMQHVSDYIKNIDAIPAHFQRHFLHAIQIIGYKHPIEYTRKFWHDVYVRLVTEMHLHPESQYDMDKRLGDNIENWKARADPATET